MYRKSYDDIGDLWEKIVEPMMQDEFYPDIRHFGTWDVLQEWHVIFWRQGRCVGSCRTQRLADALVSARDDALESWPKVQLRIKEEEQMINQWEKDNRQTNSMTEEAAEEIVRSLDKDTLRKVLLQFRK